MASRHGAQRDAESGAPGAWLGGSDLAALAFHGAAGEVTGSAFLLETRRSRVLFECGLFQGGREAREKNRAPFPFDPATLDAVVLTHAHIDHSGLLPRLVSEGYAGRVDVTAGTADLCGILLRDSAFLQEQDAERISRRRKRRGSRPVEPLYTAEDAEQAIARLRPRAMDERVQLTEDVALRFCYAGHILGAASLEVWIRDQAHERKIVLSGDVGRFESPLLREPEPPEEADLVLLESTYGDRDHRDMEATLDEFAEILVAAAREKAKVVIPAFAVGRSQEILYFLGKLEREGRVPVRQVFLDSPMAITVSQLYERNRDCFHPAFRDAHDREGTPLEPERCVFTRGWEDSMRINFEEDAIVLSASGMCEGGRILHHLKHNLWRREVRLVIAGFQAEGTLGRAIVDGAREVRVMGEKVAVEAHVHTLGGFSAHAGQSGLLRWLGAMRGSSPTVALVHGERRKRDALATRIAAGGGREPLLPIRGDTLLVPRSGSAFRLVPH